MGVEKGGGEETLPETNIKTPPPTLRSSRPLAKKGSQICAHGEQQRPGGGGGNCARRLSFAPFPRPSWLRLLQQPARALPEGAGRGKKQGPLPGISSQSEN
ncbi:Hypothetical predicted protein [Podarcis lilfordi]|uniref:Uncharacterized protein n=1 Tax=Podarcis lilfordi TaxID=74358 RepID=A0AA35K1K4_9SAUR|nr:Hypothetical predicted protein [Podarcis lilfordi]